MAIDYWGEPYCGICNANLVGFACPVDPDHDVDGGLICEHRIEAKGCVACRTE